MDLDGIFDSLTRKRVAQELSELTSGISQDQTKLVDDFLRRLESLGSELGPGRDTEELPPEMVVFSAFVKGVQLPLMDEVVDVHSEGLGELGVCLYSDSQLFAFNDKAEGCVYLRATPPTDINGRFLTVVQSMLLDAHSWSGCTMDEEDGCKKFVFDGEWAGDEPTSVLQYLTRRVFAYKVLRYDDKRFEKLEFEISMRKAFQGDGE